MPPFSTTSPSSVSTLTGRRGRSNTTYGGGSPVHSQYQAPMLQISTKPTSPLSISTVTTTGGANAQHAAIPSHMFSINWENVLMPSAWLAARMGVDASVQSLQNAQRLLAQTPQLKTLMAAIEENVIQLLTQAMATGCVYIFSDRTVQYVELSCSVFFPRLTACLRSATHGVFVIGIPDTSFTAEELAIWKVNILRTVCQERIFAGQDLTKVHLDRFSRRFGLVALCASDLDVSASDGLAKLTPLAVTKCVKVAQQATSLEDFAAQVQKLARFVTEALAFNGPIRIAF